LRRKRRNVGRGYQDAFILDFGFLEGSAFELSFRVTYYRIIVSWHPAARADGNDGTMET
jgi:hypothetical protein